MGHLNDADRLFVFRALWFARGFDSLLPSFDQSIAIFAADAYARSSHVEELQDSRRYGGFLSNATG